MTSVVEKTLRSHYAKFEQCADCDTVLGELYTSNFVCKYRKEELSKEANSIKRNRGLMDNIIQASLDVDQFVQFCAILETTPDYKSFVKSMRTQLAIHLCEQNIVENIKLKSLVPLLVDKHVLNYNEASSLLNATADDKPEKKLLSSLLKDADKCITFLQCLKTDGQHNLVRIIDEQVNLIGNEKHRQRKLQFKQDSGIFMSTPTPMTSVEATDIADGLSKLAIVEEEGSCDLNYMHDMITDEIDLLEEQYLDELGRLERHYKDMLLILEQKKNDAVRLLGDVYWKQKENLDIMKKDVKRCMRRGRRDKMPGVHSLLPQAKPDVYVKFVADISAIDQFKEWNVPVIVGSAHYETTTAQGLGLKWACTNKSASFTVEFRDIQNQLLIAKSIDDLKNLTSNFHCMIIDSEGLVVLVEQQFIPSSSMWLKGMMTITYIPTTTGYLDILLKCSGRPIAGSPFRVLAYPLSEYYRLMTTPQEILCIREMITGLTITRSDDFAICTKSGKLYTVKHVAGEYYFVDVAAYHGGLSLNSPCGISCDSSDNLVVANTRNSQLVKASTPEVKERLLISSGPLKFEPICVAAHDRLIAAGGSRDVAICDHNLDILHTVTFSSSLSAITIANNLNIHVAISETVDNEHYNYACIERIDCKTYKTRFSHLLPSKTSNRNHRINDIVVDTEHNIIVCYKGQPIIAMFNSNGELLSCYENWGSSWFKEFTTVAVSRHGGLLMLDQTRNKLIESHLDQNLGTYTASLVDETNCY